MIRFVVSVMVLVLSACASQPSNKVAPASTENKAAIERLNAGWGYMGAGNYQRAKYHLDRALEHDSKNAKIHAALGHYYAEVGEKARAQEAFEESIRLNRQDGDNLNLYGVFLCREGKYAAAEEQFKRAMNLKSYNNIASTLENAGLCALKSGNEEKAEEHFVRAVRHNPNQANALLELGYLDFKKGNLVRARSFLDRYVGAAADTARSLWLGIQLANAQGDKDRVASWGLKLERLYPESEEAIQYAEKRNQWRK